MIPCTLNSRISARALIDCLSLKEGGGRFFKREIDQIVILKRAVNVMLKILRDRFGISVLFGNCGCFFMGG